MSFNTLNYTKVIKLFGQKAKSLISTLPKGLKQTAGRLLQHFLVKEKEILRKWYGGLLLRVLDGEDFSSLLATKKKGLYFSKLGKAGLDREKLNILREELFKLLKTTCINSSGAGQLTETKYKVRLYRLPDNKMQMSNGSRGKSI